MTSTPTAIKEYLAARGGPFYELQRQLGLLRDDAFHAPSRAMLFVTLAWGVPLVLSLLAGHAFGPLASKPFLLDPGPVARLLVAVGLFILMELQVERKLRTLLDQFVRAPLIAPGSLAAGADVVTEALRRRDSRTAELICLALAVALSVVVVLTPIDAETSSWRAQAVDGSMRRTLAGWWCLVVSNPIFWFLLFRWLWRHIVWAMLLRKLSRLELRLSASHPDGSGGLGFVGQYPNVYSTFVLGVSSVVGAAVANQQLHGTLSLANYSAIMAGWLAIVLALFAWPLSAFSRPLARLKEQTTLLASAQATARARAVEREVLGRNVIDAGETDGAKSSDIPDPIKIYDTAQKLSTILIRREALVPVSAAALAPIVLAGAAQLPIKELIGIAKHLLLL